MDEWTRVVQPRTTFLYDHLIVTDRLLHLLIQKGHLGPDQLEEIKLKKTRREKIDLLIWSYVSRRGPGSLKAFCDALREDNPPQVYLAEELTSGMGVIRAVQVRDTKAPTSSSKMTGQQPTPHQLLDLREKIGGVWESVARFLDYSRDDIKRFQKNDPYDVADQCSSMLDEWIEREASKATVHRLIEALLKAKRRDTAEKVFGVELVAEVISVT